MKKSRDGLDVADYVMTFVMLILFAFTVVIDNHQKRVMNEAAEQKRTVTVETVATVEEPEPVEEVKEPVIVWQGSSEIPLREDEQEQLFLLCHKYDVPMAYALAIMETESDFDPEAVGSLGEVGLFQIHPVHWDTMAQNGIDVHEPYGNMEAGVMLIHDCLISFRDLEAATMGFKCGKYRAIELVADGVRLESCKEVTELAIYYEPIVSELGYIER